MNTATSPASPASSVSLGACARALALSAEHLRRSITPDALDFEHTGELVGQPLPWIGQERAFAAARFGLRLEQPDYNLFVLGEVGTGRASLMRQAMQDVAGSRPVPPDLCYLHDFDKPERPRVLRLPAGQGRTLRQGMQQWAKALEVEIPRRLAAADVRAQTERIHKDYQTQEAHAYAALVQFAQERHFRVSRDNGQMLFSLLGKNHKPLTDTQAQELTPEQRSHIERTEQELRAEIVRFFEATRPLERTRDEALTALLRQTAKPLLAHALDDIRQSLRKQIKDTVKIGQWLDQVQREVLDNLELFVPQDSGASGASAASDNDAANELAEEARRAEAQALLALCQVNLAVDNSRLRGAPVVVEDNPQLRSLFGYIEHHSDEDAPQADFSCIHAGSLLRAHGGYLMLYLRDLLGDEPLWERLRRFLRCSRLTIEDSTAHSSGASVALQPESVDVQVKIVLIGTAPEYYVLQAGDSDLSRHFRIKVDFADQFMATPETYQNSAIFIARSCARRGLPHCSAAAVARLLEQSHREADDQQRQSALFASTEALLIESAAVARARGASLTEAQDVQQALQARQQRHNAPEQGLHEAIADGELLISVHGWQVGQLNALTQIDQGDYRFGFPVRITARTFAGQEGVINIEREVQMSGPIHDKGVLILQSYLTALFGALAPLALNASVVFEQEYSGIEGDSASCAELYVLLSSLSGLALRQEVAVTGALNQHGEVLPVGGLNEKIEGWFRTCSQAGLTGTQGVLIPARNQRHLMLDPQVVQAVQAGQFHIYAVQHVSQGMALLTGATEGEGEGGTARVLDQAAATLQAYRRACQQAHWGTAGRGRRSRSTLLPPTFPPTW